MLITRSSTWNAFSFDAKGTQKLSSVCDMSNLSDNTTDISIHPPRGDVRLETRFDVSDSELASHA